MSTRYLLEPGFSDEFLTSIINGHLAAVRQDAPPPNSIRLVDRRALERRLSEETHQERKAAMQPLMGLAQAKVLVIAEPKHLTAIAGLEQAMPNAGPLLQRVQSRLRAQIVGRRPIHLGSLLLEGDPGNGKSHAMRRVGEALGLPLFELALGGTADTLSLIGSARNWSGSGPGRIAMALAQCPVANPIFLLDEIDKTGAFANAGAVEDVLLGLLEPENSVRFDDKFLAIPIDASHASYISTANRLDALSEPLLSRLETVSIEAPTSAQWPMLIELLYTAALAEMGLQSVFRERWPTWRVLDLLAGCKSIRELKRRIRQGIELALAEVPADQLLVARDLLPCAVERSEEEAVGGRRMGFL